MATTNQTSNSHSQNKPEPEIKQNLDIIIDLLSELNPTENSPKSDDLGEERVTLLENKEKSRDSLRESLDESHHKKNKVPQKDNFQFSNYNINQQTERETKSTTISTHNTFENKEKAQGSFLKSSDSTPQLNQISNNSIIQKQQVVEQKNKSLAQKEIELPAQSPSFDAEKTSNGHKSVSINQNNYSDAQTVAILRQSVRNLEKKLRNNQSQLDEVIDSVNSLMSLAAELTGYQYNATSNLIVGIVEPIIDDIIEQRSTEDLARMGQVLANILPVAISKQIEATPQSIAKALAPEIALSIQEQIRLDTESISRSIGPEMGKAIKNQIELERDAMVDALYPVIGSTIAKYMAEVITTINEKVENAVSIEGFQRKIRAKIQGVSEAELILQEAIPYEVQAIFLIHKASGLVICELQPDLAHQLESDLLAGMLTAIQSFANDLIAESSELDEIDYGEYRIILEVAGYCYLAVVVKGSPSQQFRQKVRDALSNLVLKQGNIIEVYNGDSSTVPESIELFLEQLLEQEQKRNSSKSPTTLFWLVLTILGLIFVPWGIFKYKNHVADRITQQTAIALDAAPELSVYRLTPKVERDKLILAGRVPSEYLRNKAAETATKIAQVEQLTLENQIIAINIPTDPTITEEEVARITSILNKQAKVAIVSNFQDRTVTVKGFDLNRPSNFLIAEDFKKIPGIDRVIISLSKQLPIINSRIYFASGSIELDLADFNDQINKVRQLLTTYPQLNLRIIGHSDRIGTSEDNQKLAQDRADKVSKSLVKQGIELTRLEIIGSIEPPPGVTVDQPLQKSRCVRFEFLIPDNGNHAQYN